MEYNFVDSAVPDLVDPITGLNKDAKGGTEMMYKGLQNRIDPDIFDKIQIICSRVRTLDERPKVLWLHDTWDDPESAKLKDENFRKQFSKIIMVSDYQMQTYNLGLGVPYDDCLVLKNCIEPIHGNIAEVDDTIRLIYHTTPHRGLAILLPVFDWLCKQFTDLKFHLDVYSSFDIYGWTQKNAEFENLYDFCKKHENITYHGTVSNDEVREALTKAHIFAYPNIWPETSCLAVIEAMSAGCIVVHPNFGALPETMSNFGVQYQFSENMNKHANIFASMLVGVVNNIKSEVLTNKRINSMHNVLHNYSWDVRLHQWETLLTSIVKNKA